jgi:hypothetical protein
MARFLAVFSNFHISAALALATVAFLAVPESAFSDDPRVTSCIAGCPNTVPPTYWACVAGCCNKYGAGDCCNCAKDDTDCQIYCEGALDVPCSGSGCDVKSKCKNAANCITNHKIGCEGPDPKGPEGSCSGCNCQPASYDMSICYCTPL